MEGVMADVVYLKPRSKTTVRMPRKVKVGHRIFSIVNWSEAAADASGALGNCQQDPPIIRIASHLKPFDKAGVMIHELGHACWIDRPTEGVSEEDAVSWLSAGYSGIWTNNPDLVEWISHCLIEKKEQK
jgi:hypothetical protein